MAVRDDVFEKSAAGLPEDVIRLLEQVCHQIVLRLGATSAALSRWDRDQDRVLPWIPYALEPDLEQPAHVESVDRYALEDYPSAALVLHECQAVSLRVDDPQIDPAERELLDKVGQQAVLMLPVVTGGQASGLLEIFQRERPRVFDPDEIEIAQALAEQASIILENVHLFRECERRSTELAMVNELSQALSSALGLDELLEQIYLQVSRMFDTDNFYIATYEEGSEEWTSAFHLEQGVLQPLLQHQVSVGMTGYIIRSREAVLLDSVAENKAFHEAQGLPSLGDPAKSWLGVPLISANRLVGVMAIQDYGQEGVYSKDDLALFSTIAGQAATALYNLNLLGRARRRAQDMEVINEVGRAIASVLDLDELLQQIVDIAKTRFGYYFVSIALLDDGRALLRAGSTIGDSEARMDVRQVVIDLDRGPSLMAEAVRTGRPVLANDVLSDDRYLSVDELPETRSELVVPVWFQDRVIGLLDVQSDQINAYDASDVALLQSLTNQAGVAIENARLHQDRERRITELSILNEIVRSFSSALELDQVTQAVYEQVGRVFDTSSFFMALYDPERKEWETVSDIVKGEPQPLMRASVQEGLTGYIIRNRQSLLFNTAEALEEFYEAHGLEEIGQSAQSWMGVPMVAGDRVVGTIAVESYEQPYRYSEQDQEIFATIAAQAAAAIENARLYEESRRRSDDLVSLLQVGTTLVSSFDIQEVLGAICREAVNLLRATSAYVCEWDESQSSSTVIAEYYGPEAAPKERVSDLGESYIEEGRTIDRLKGGRPYQLHTSDPDLAPLDRSLLLVYGGKSVLRLALAARGRAIGYIEVWESRYERSFTEEETLLGQNLANQAAVAIENARLYGRVQEQLEELRQAGETQSHLLQQVQQMSTPIIPLHNHILLLPLIGMVDSERTRQFTDRLLEAVRRQRARVVLLDITGVPIVDTAVAQALLQAAEAARLLGAEVVLVGVRAEVAQTLVMLGLNMEVLVTKSNLQAGIEHALDRLGLGISETG